MKFSTLREPPEFWSCRRGATAIEFALVALPLIWLLGTILETGALFVTQFELQLATERAARLLRTNQLTAVSTVEDFKKKVCEKLTIQNCSQLIHVDVRHDDSFDLLSPPAVETIGPALAKGGYDDVYDPGSTGDAGSLFVTYDWTFIFPFLGKQFGFANVAGRTDVRRLHGSSIYMHELP